MKKKLFAVLLCAALSCLLCVAVLAADENYFNVEIRTETSDNGTVILTIGDSPVLAEKAPKLKIPFTETENVHVFHDGAELESAADGSYVSFAVSKGGQYFIAADASAAVREILPDCTQDGYYTYSLNGETFTEPSGKTALGHRFWEDEPACTVCGAANPYYVAPEEPEEPEEGYAACLGDHTCPMSKFTDVDENAWYHDGVHYCVENGLMIGTSDTTFDPIEITTRGQIVTILYRLEGEPALMNDNVFDDVASGSWYEKAVVWAQGKGIVQGYGNGRFGPEDSFTREQLATILYRYAQYKGIDVSVDENTNFLSFNDFQDISEYAKPTMMWALANGIIQGDNWNIMTQGDAARAQAAAILQRFCEKIVK